MKVKLVETVVRELEVSVPNELDALVDIFQAAVGAAQGGQGTELPGSKRNLGFTVVCVSDDGGDVLMVQRAGQILVTQEGGTRFRETRDQAEAAEKAGN
jgi:hypothetical protein